MSALPPMNRRQATLTFGALWTTLVIPPSAFAATAPLTWTPRALTPEQARVLDAVCELIIPATDTPGAREAGVPQFVDRAIGDYCPPAQARAIRAGLDRIDARSREAHGAGFASLSSAQQTDVLTAFDRAGRDPRPAAQPVGRGETETGLSNRVGPATSPEATPFFPALKELVTVGYFTSQLGATKAVRYDQTPGAYHGCVPLAQIGRAWAL